MSKIIIIKLPISLYDSFIFKEIKKIFKLFLFEFLLFNVDINRLGKILTYYK